MPVRVLLLVLAAVAAACAESESEKCEDGSFCPAGSRCAAGGVCLVEPEACADFAENAPCDLEGASGFCREETCEPGVVVSGRLTAQGSGGGLPGLAVTGVDRPWMAGDTTDSTGLFELLAVQGDPSLEVSIAGDEQIAPIRTRLLQLGSERYELNGRATEALRAFRRDRLIEMAELVDLSHDPATGTIAIQVGREAGNPIGGATVELAGGPPAPVLYFAGDGAPAPDLTSTSPGAGAAVFLEVIPGRYQLTTSHPLASGCAGAGADQPDPIELEVVAGTVTTVGWVICEMAARPVSDPARSRRPRPS
jgi:hypothetical protein